MLEGTIIDNGNNTTTYFYVNENPNQSTNIGILLHRTTQYPNILYNVNVDGDTGFAYSPSTNGLYYIDGSSYYQVDKDELQSLSSTLSASDGLIYSLVNSLLNSIGRSSGSSSASSGNSPHVGDTETKYTSSGKKVILTYQGNGTWTSKGGAGEEYDHLYDSPPENHQETETSSESYPSYNLNPVTLMPYDKQLYGPYRFNNPQTGDDVMEGALFDLVTGTSDISRNYGPLNPWTKSLQKHPHLTIVIV